MKHIIYLHGFNSSPQSEKAKLVQEYFDSPTCQVHVPALPPAPLEAIALVECIYGSLQGEEVLGFVGSSLGGYYSLYLHQRFNLPAVLINPAVCPYELLMNYLGENTNLYTGESYIVEPHHMDELKALDVAPNPASRQLYLLTQTDDETLDYSQATSKLSRVPTWVQYGGDHAFQNFKRVLPSIDRFLNRL